LSPVPTGNSLNRESDFTDEADCYGTLTTGYVYDENGEYYDDYDEPYTVRKPFHFLNLIFFKIKTLVWILVPTNTKNIFLDELYLINV
jgi:hypothetical protein